jgi:GNAT superfamily N-acetyltransferase
VSLREQILWRTGELTSGQSIDLGEKIEHFPEVKEAFSIDGFKTKLLPKSAEDPGSKASLEDGGSLLLTGLIHTPPPGPRMVAIFKRRLQLDLGWAIHEYLEVKPEFRGQGINLQLLRRSFDFYDALGLESVHLKASLATGRWHWARVGFEFHREHDRDAVRDWAVSVCEALKITGLSVENYSSAAQLVRMGGNRTASLEEIADAMPAERSRLEELAAANELAFNARLDLGRAVMLSGPDWMGRLELGGPSRVAFGIYADGKEERLRNEMQG